MDSQESHDKSDVAQKEEEIQAFWERNDIFKKTEARDAPRGEFVFYDGPPFATGLPHYGHILAGTIKDAIPRYRTMRGFRVHRRWGWDCHGLPLENQIEKELGLETKRDIEKLGVATFNEAARNAVLRYADEWKKQVPRLGRWVDMEDDYKTMDTTYSESVWWAFNDLYNNGLVYEGFKSMHLCPRCGTTLSNFEVNQGYKDIVDFAVTVALPLLEDNRVSLLVWTTTPWTLPGNMAAAVNADAEYVKVKSYEGMPTQVESSGIRGGDVTRQAFIKKGTYILAKEVFWRNIQGNDGLIEIRSLFNDLDKLKQDTIRFASNPAGFFNEYKDQIEIIKGVELVGKSYVPPFNYFEDKEIPGKENAWKIYHADYVSLEDGTGAVHLAPAFGAEDMLLAEAHGIPLIHHVTKEGVFSNDVTDFKGMPVKPKGDHQVADIEIIKYLAHHGRLFKKEKITHSYPHCWRCDTPLLNYAASSWFVRVSSFKDKLVSENKKIGWVPKEIGERRFGNWLEGAPDWAISRSRYWGAPLPVWRDEKTGTCTVVGSIEELTSKTKRSGNSYVIMRHGEAELSKKEILNTKTDVSNALTPSGREQVARIASELKKKGITYIFVSPLPRTVQTAMVVAKELGIAEDHVIADPRLIEISFGIYEGKTISEYHSFYPTMTSRLTTAPQGAETWNAVKRRTAEMLYELEHDYEDTSILIISHNGPLQMLQAGAFGWDEKTVVEKLSAGNIAMEMGEIRDLAFVPLPHNPNYVLDLHRPYIDAVKLVGSDGALLTRIPDVFDCWFESGSMPYGQKHYPFENTDSFEPRPGLLSRARGYPADFISEGLDQTRGWFYSLLVLGYALFGKAPYKNVIVSGLVLAEDGQKMSKRLKNYPDPMGVVDIYGADALRYYLLSSPLLRGEDLNFSEAGVAEVMRKLIVRLRNVHSFLELYPGALNASVCAPASSHPLDLWILARLRELTLQTTDAMEAYELDAATRPLMKFVDDLSTWYVRRSRERLKGENALDQEAAYQTLRYVLREVAKLMAPFTPFFAEELYKAITAGTETESVHLAMWPEAQELDASQRKLLHAMEEVRSLVSEALEARQKSAIRVRQPLRLLTIKPTQELSEELLELIALEINVKEVIVDATLKQSVLLDTTITDALKEEGVARELIRRIQELRKAAGLTPQDRAAVTISANAPAKAVLEKYAEHISKAALLQTLHIVDAHAGDQLVFEEYAFSLTVEK